MPKSRKRIILSFPEEERRYGEDIVNISPHKLDSAN
jgi:hypothetical protein